MKVAGFALLCCASLLPSTGTAEVVPYYSTGTGRTSSSSSSSSIAAAPQGALKGATSSAAAKPQKVKKGGSKGCETLPLFYKYEDVDFVEFPDTYEFRFVVDAYIRGNPKPAGHYLVDALYINNVTDDGIGNGVMSFNDGSGLSWNGPLLYGSSGILGGAGRYACATGYLTPGSGPNPEAAYFNAVVCGGC